MIMDMEYAIGINVLLKHCPITHLVENLTGSRQQLRYFSDYMPEHVFVRGCQQEYSQFSLNECENIYKKLSEGVHSNQGDKTTIFHLFNDIAADVLSLDGDRVICKHSQLVAWRETVHSIGQSIFICAFMAHEDCHNHDPRQEKATRSDFFFSPYVQTDNIRLRNMLSRGMAENHFHLKGSAPAFLASWVCLMNRIESRESEFRQEAMRDRLFRAPIGDEQLSLCETTQIAAWLRLHMYRWLDGDNNDMHEEISRFLRALEYTPFTWVADLQHKLSAEKRMNGDSKLDYASNEEGDSDRAYALISGEHRFLYRMFYAIYSRQQGVEEMYRPFFVYLMAYIRLRAELVQCNMAVGFQNFLVYERRKDIFVEKYGEYEKAYLKMALDSVLQHKFIKSLEVRIAPKENYNEFFGAMEDYWRITTDNKTKEEKLFFVVHLIKKPDRRINARSNLGQFAPMRCRHDELRRGEYRRQVKNILRLQRDSRPFASRLYGIDACNHESYARPEVFAPLFRMARYESSRLKRNNQWQPVSRLHIAFHVGEDFLDIVSGLRAVYEAIKFLQLSHGDRIGHALALGVEPADYYMLKGKRLYLPLQEALDNMAFLLYSLQKYGIHDHAFESWLKDKFDEYFLCLFRANIPLTDVEHNVERYSYINSWTLRGDEPLLYSDYTIVSNSIRFNANALFSESYNILNDEYCKHIRANDTQARRLYHQYHYNGIIRDCGEQIVALDIPEGYSKIVRQLQNAMLSDVCRRGVAIECNPSSNRLIGTFGRYDKHPIVRFYNRWLDSDSAAPQAFVSINTDDQGIFDSDLESEYALMASALESLTDVDDNNHLLYNVSNIYRWLDDVREMGLEQSYLHTHRRLGNGR